MIAPMKKVSIVCMKEDREKVLKALQHSALMMIVSSDTGVLGGDKGYGERERRTDQLLRELSKFGKKKGMFSEVTEIGENDFDTISEETVGVCKRIEELIEKREALTSEAVSLKTTLETLTGWEALSANAEDITATKSTEIVTGRLPKNALEGFEAEGSGLDMSWEKVFENEKVAHLLLVYMKDDEASVRSLLLDHGFEEIKLPVEAGKVLEKIEEAKKRLLEIEDEKAQIANELEGISEKSKCDVEVLFEQYRAGALRADVRLDETVEAVFIEGWVREDCAEKLEAVVKESTPIYDIEFRDPEENEDVPTSLTNSKTVSQFEGITEMFNPPKYNDFDPNAVMAPWYWIIFGMMMGDAGYGLMMAVLIGILKKLMKPTGGTAKLINVLLYSSITTIFFGVLFGSYFGEELFPPLITFTAMGDPIKMLLFTIIVGVLHIFTGMITKMVIDIRSGHPWDAVFDQLSWMLVITGIGMLFVKPIQKIGLILAIVGALTILFTAGRHKKGIFGKITGGLLGLYNITSYFSDILSYSRILALSLATGVVGMVMNMLAGMIQGNAIGFILSLVIYIVGHVFNLVLGLLSAYVHASRLQYIEFYGKFYEGGGTVFRPFSVKTNYINIKKD